MTVTVSWAFGVGAVLSLILLLVRILSGLVDWNDELLLAWVGFTLLASCTTLFRHCLSEHDVARANREAEALALRQEGADDAKMEIPLCPYGPNDWRSREWTAGWIAERRGAKLSTGAKNE